MPGYPFLTTSDVSNSSTTKMKKFYGDYKPTNTTEFLVKLNKFVYLFGLPNYWVEDLNYSDMFKKMFDKFNKFGNFIIFVMLFSEFAAFFTQKNLTDEQSSNLILFSIGHTIPVMFRVRMTYQEDEIRDVMYKLGISLKEVYNDVVVEGQMIKKSKFFSLSLMLSCGISVLLLTVEAILKVVLSGITFNVVITAWPATEDSSVWSNVLRTVIYITWWIHMTRAFAVYTLVICLTVALAYQFKNLNSYFYSLKDIFNNESQLSQRKKEGKYEEAFKVGIKLHSETLKCTREIQTICRDVYSGQIIFNVILLVVLMFQMMSSARNVANTITIVVTALAILLATGFIMWTAGDVTVEAEKLSTAMFGSGWENCERESSVRVRKLVVISMMQAQKPVYMTGLGIITLSYQSYVSIVKSSYSVFSVLY